MTFESLTSRTLDEVVTAINMRINHIETGTVTYSAFDAKAYNDTLNMGDSRDRARVIPINPLSREQRDTIDRLEDARAVLQQESINNADGDLEEDTPLPAKKKKLGKKKPRR